MYLSELRVKGFRRLRDAEFTFHDGLNVIVGENNSGKTAIVDAIRTVLNYRRFDIDDLYVENGKPASSTSIEAIFDGADVDDQAAFIHALIPGKDRSKDYRIRIAVDATLKNDELDRKPSLGFGSTSGSYYDVLTRQRLDYLQALRDPYGSEGLRAGRQSKLYHLMRRTTSEAERAHLEDIAFEANERMQGTDPIARATKIVNTNLDLMSGLAYAMTANLNFVEPDFNRLAAQLEGSSDGLNVGMMGLGSGNMVYISAVLGDMTNANDVENKRYRALIIEEPEAHLHPQRQILLLRFLEEQVEKRDRALQIFVTTHSPILASQAAMKSLLPLIDTKVKVNGANVLRTISKPVDTGKSTREATRIKQYLDATRSELFFAKHLILVEGDSERLLLPQLARTWEGKDLERRGVTIVSAAGLNFLVFLPFIKSDVLNIKVAILTDSDKPRADDGKELSESDYVLRLRAAIKDDPNLDVFVADQTFEYELSLPEENRPFLLEAISTVRPKKGPEFAREHQETGKEFAANFYREFFGNGSTSKAEFAMELSLLLKDKTGFKVPDYIIEAFRWILPPDGSPSNAPRAGQAVD
jgi:putative ATP-dependent endonuclease of OLD family